MIADLIEFGEWLSQNKQDEFGKNLNLDEDYIFRVKFDENLKDFEFDGIVPIKEENGKVPYYNASIFNDYYYITTDQKVIIPSNSNLIGITPFLLKLDQDFLDKNSSKDQNKLNKFYKKIERSKNVNGDGKEFVELINSIYKDTNAYLSKIPLSDEENRNLKSFFENFSFDTIGETIKGYYNWLYDNRELLADKIIEFKSRKDSKEIKRSNFYLTCYFGSEMDLLNDICYYYSKFVKERKKEFKEVEDAPCSFCESNGNVYPSLGDFVMGNAAFSFNYDDNKNTVVKNSRIKLCKKCATYAMLAEDKLMKILPNNILLVPKKIDGDYGEFLKEMTKEDKPSFERVNTVLRNVPGFTYDLILYKNKKQGKGYVVEKYIENYKSYLARVRSGETNDHWFDESIKLYEDKKLGYLLFEGNLEPSEKEPHDIKNIFQFEYLFKQFFINVKESKLVYPKLYYFYYIYTRDLTGKAGIVGNLDSKTFTIFSKYMHSIFNFIYELNPDAIDKNMLNEMVLNCLVKIVKNMEKPRYPILKRLNYYLMLNKELLGDKMLEKNDVNKLKSAVGKYKRDDSEVIEEILELIQENPSLKYYLIGKFLKLIDNSKYQGGKKPDIFGNFVTNANRNNIKNLFVTEVLQKNNYYIQRMNPKGKLVFNLIENDINSLFNEESNLSFEDYLLSIFAGYYTENILKGGDLNE
jgi:CRISPR-associated protein Csh1